MYKPPKPVTQKPSVKSPLQILAPRGDVLGKLPSNTKQNKAKTVNLLSTMRLAQSSLKRKYPSVDISPSVYKPLKKGLLKI